MRSHRRWAAALLSVGLVAGIAACGSDDDDGATTTAGDLAGTTAPDADTDSDGTTTPPAGEPERGGQLQFGQHANFTSLDVTRIVDYQNGGAEGNRAFAIFDALIVSDPTTGEVQPRIAESFETDDGGATFTLTLREGVEFSDGTPYDAAAVQYNWERFADPDANAVAFPYASMVGDYEVVDPLTLTFSVDPPTLGFPRIVARFMAGLGSPTAIEELGAGFAETPVGAGPFVVEEWVRDSHLRLVRNDNYWRADEGLPYLDELVIRFIPDEQQRIQAVIAGDLLMGQTPNTQVIAQAHDADLDVHLQSTATGRWMFLNEQAPPFDNPLAVDAIQAGFSSQAYVETVEGPRGEAANSLFREDSPFYSDSGTFPEYDPVRAQELLDQYAAETGQPLRFTFMTTETIRSGGEAVVTLLSAYDNIEIELEVIPTSELVPRTLAREFQASMISNSFIDPYPELHLTFHSDGPRNFSAFDNANLDAALDAAAVAEDPDERLAAYAEVQRIAAEELPMMMLNRSFNAFYYQGDRLQNLTVFNDFTPFWDEVWLTS